MEDVRLQPLSVNVRDYPEEEHPRHLRVFIKTILSSAEHKDLSLHRTRVEVGGEIRPHSHEAHTETYFILSGRGVGVLGDVEYGFSAGSVGCAPPGTLHSLRNVGEEPLEMIAIFTPPLR